MKTSPKKVVAVVVGLILAFLFLVPVVSYAFPPGVYDCPANGCDFPRYGSVTYWGLGAGGVWTYVNSYSISAVTTITPVNATSSVSYTVSAEPTSTATTFINPANELELQLSLNTSSSSATGVSVSVVVDAYNPSSSTANVTAANDWLVTLSYSDGAPCGDDGPPIGFAIAEGYYTSSNITAAKFLDLVNPGATYNCPLYLGYGNPTGFAFQPMSDIAASYGCDQQQCMSGSMSTGLTSASWGAVIGYWEQGGVFTSFPRGTYTTLAEDEWGDSVLAYFTVS